ncbi:MAG: hypothetical protein ABI771_13825 [Betaproteobacteria bacterium]
MSTRTFLMYVAALLLATVSMQANAAARKADCRYWLMDVNALPTSIPGGALGNPTGFALILATTQHDILAFASTPARNTDSEDYIQALERLLRRSGRE